MALSSPKYTVQYEYSKVTCYSVMFVSGLVKTLKLFPLLFQTIRGICI
jgi:hypothetical protein